MDLDFGSISNLIGVTAFTALYDKFLGLFPTPLHWIVSLIVLASLVMAFFVLIRFHWLFLLLLVIFLPLAFPVLKTLFSGLYDLFLYLVQIVTEGIKNAT